MGLGLGLCMWWGDRMAFKCQGIARIGISEDGADLTHGNLGQAISGDSATDALVADMIGDNPALAAAINRPNDCPI